MYSFHNKLLQETEQPKAVPHVDTCTYQIGHCLVHLSSVCLRKLILRQNQRKCIILGIVYIMIHLSRSVWPSFTFCAASEVVESSQWTMGNTEMCTFTSWVVLLLRSCMKNCLHAVNTNTYQERIKMGD